VSGSTRRQPARALLLDLDGVLWVDGAAEPELLAFVREVRGRGLPVALAIDESSTLDEEPSLVDELDTVVTSASAGRHRPTREFFAAACLAVRTPPGRCLYVDDDDRNVSAARVAGLSAYRWNGPSDLPYLRAALNG
jgi:putative hydrolase of the HAD superfamily